MNIYKQAIHDCFIFWFRIYFTFQLYEVLCLSAYILYFVTYYYYELLLLIIILFGLTWTWRVHACRWKYPQNVILRWTRTSLLKFTGLHSNNLAIIIVYLYIELLLVHLISTMKHIYNYGRFIFCHIGKQKHCFHFIFRNFDLEWLFFLLHIFIQYYFEFLMMNFILHSTIFTLNYYNFISETKIIFDA